MEVQGNYTSAGVACLDDKDYMQEMVHDETFMDVRQAFNLFMLCHEPGQFLSQHSKLDIAQEALKAEFIDLLHKEGLISKEISYTAKKLIREAGNSGFTK